MIALLLCAQAALLRAGCQPAVVVRGEQVSCAARVEPPRAFVLVGKRAEAGGRRVDDPSEARYEVGGEARWAGVAVRDTLVTFAALVDGETQRAQASFSVEPRRWPRLILTGSVAPWAYGPDSMFGGWPPRPRAEGDSLVADGALGTFVLSQASPRVAYVEDGPDARWLYAGSPAPQPEARVYLSRALRPGDPFYEAQIGGGGIPSPFCAPHDLEVLRLRLLQHEGAVESAAPSHFGETKRALLQRDLQAELESQTLFYDDAVMGPTLGERLTALIRRAHAGIEAEQRDPVDRLHPVALPCRLRRP